MKHRGNMQAEPRVQSIFSNAFSSLMVAAPILLTAAWHDQQPSRWPGVDRLVTAQAKQLMATPRMRAARCRGVTTRCDETSVIYLARCRSYGNNQACS